MSLEPFFTSKTVCRSSTSEGIIADVIRLPPEGDNPLRYKKIITGIRSTLIDNEQRILSRLSQTPNVVRLENFESAINQADSSKSVQSIITRSAGVDLSGWSKVGVHILKGNQRIADIFYHPSMLISLLRYALYSLHGIHQEDIIHCDIKLDCLCLPYTGADAHRGQQITLHFDQLTLIDFGHSQRRIIDTSDPCWLGKCDADLRYQSEQLMQVLDQWSYEYSKSSTGQNSYLSLDYSCDLYSLGFAFNDINRALSYVRDESNCLLIEAQPWSLVWKDYTNIVAKLLSYDNGKPSNESTLPHESMIKILDDLISKLDDHYGYSVKNIDVKLMLTSSDERALVTPIKPSPLREEKENLSNQEVFWTIIKKSDTVESYQSYLQSFPHGDYATQAKNAIDRLKENNPLPVSTRTQMIEIHPPVSPQPTNSILKTMLYIVVIIIAVVFAMTVFSVFNNKDEKQHPMIESVLNYFGHNPRLNDLTVDIEKIESVWHSMPTEQQAQYNELIRQDNKLAIIYTAKNRASSDEDYDTIITDLQLSSQVIDDLKTIYSQKVNDKEKQSALILATHYEALGNVSDAIDWYEKNGNSESKYRIAQLYHHGHGNFEADEKQAVDWYRQSAEEGCDEAIYPLAKLLDNHEDAEVRDREEALAWYQSFVVRHPDSADVWYRIGEMYADVPMLLDSTKAIDNFKKADEYGHDEAKEKIAHLYAQEGESDEAIAWYKKIADAESQNANARYEIAELYKKQAKYVSAIEWYKKATNLDHQNAMLTLANLYYDKEIVKNKLKARYWYKKYSKNNTDKEVLYRIGKIYHSEENYDSAVDWYRKAAVEGHETAYFHLGYLLQTKSSVRDYQEAAKWYQKAVDMGNASAMNNLGNMYRRGDGVTQSYAQAKELYERGHNSGNHYATKNLADLYYFGYGVEENEPKAAELYLEMADKGTDDIYISAMRKLSYIYRRNGGDEKSAYWNNKAKQAESN